MTTKQFLIGLGFVFIIGSCAEKRQEASADHYSWSAADSTAAYVSSAYTSEPSGNNGNPGEGVSSSAAVETNKNDGRKFIRTADLRFKAKNVIKATYGIEDVASRHGGFVTLSQLTSSVESVNTTAVSADSSLETTFYTVSNRMTIRVPNTKLDTTLKDIAKYIDYLDHRTIEANDVAIQMLGNELTQKRSAKTEKRLTDAIDNRGKKLNETVASEEILAYKQEQADNAKIANMSLNDQINYSTITLWIYQRQDVKRELIPNHKNIRSYESGFGQKIVDALKSGWHILEVIILFVLNLWGVLLSLAVAYLVFRYVSKKMKK